jgi:hypothetical protein
LRRLVPSWSTWAGDYLVGSAALMLGYYQREMTDDVDAVYFSQTVDG